MYFNELKWRYFFYTFCEREKNIWIFRLYYSAKKTTYSNTYHISLLLLPSSLSKNMIRVPMLVPGLEYTFEIQVECISDLGISDQLHVFVTRDQVNKCRTICIVSTIVLIKMSENLIDADDATYSGSREEIYGIWLYRVFYMDQAYFVPLLWRAYEHHDTFEGAVLYEKWRHFFCHNYFLLSDDKFLSKILMNLKIHIEHLMSSTYHYICASNMKPFFTK